MVTATALALLITRTPMLASDAPGSLWEETPVMLKLPGYHPMIRFGTWEITRFNRSTTYMFATPDLVQQGQYQASNNRYFFRAVMANELENADKAKLVDDMEPGAAEGLNRAYARSMSNFEGTYNPKTRALYISYMVNGIMKQFELHDMTEGDDQLTPRLSDFERGLPGFWHAPDPYPGKLDARTRTKIQENGLQMFANEASASDGAQFNVLDVRVDKTFRQHGTLGTWVREGQMLVLIVDGHRSSLEISRDGTKLLKNGKTAYVR